MSGGVSNGSPAAGHSILGVAVQRSEDAVMVRGASRYTADLAVEGLLHLVVVRSPIAHGRVRTLTTAAAAGAPGVVAVLTAGDFAIAPSCVPFLAGLLPPAFWRPLLAGDVVRYVGEPLAVVIAETTAQALDGAGLVEVEFDPLPPAVGVEEAAGEGAPLVFPEAGTNIALELVFEAGPPAATDGGNVTVEARILNQRIAAAPMEPSSILAAPGPPGPVLTVWASTQTPHGLRDFLASGLELAPDQIRVVTPAVGGGFGAKGAFDAEYLLVAAAALRVGRPVRYVQTRSENLLLSTARGQVQHVRLTSTATGELVALDVRLLADGGAYPGIGAFLPMLTRSMATGVYRIPRVSYEIKAIATTTAPNGGFRGAGRPEATALIERMMDLLAVELGMDPSELRRQNLVAADEFPYTTVMGTTYDSGDYRAALDALLEHAGYAQLRAEQAARRASGHPRLLGLGLSTYVEVTAAGGWDEFGSVEVQTDGRVRVLSGTAAHGQGHATTYAQIVADTLGVGFDAIDVVEGDTAIIPTGGGTIGSRSIQIGGSAVLTASREVLDKARSLAAHLLEADPADVVIDREGGRLAVAGVPSSGIGWGDLAVAASDPGRRPAGMEPGLAAAPGFTQAAATYPFGAHLAVVEVDAETGRVELIRMVAVDDCGNVINPLLAAGQVHGGLATGIAQALFEEVVFDDEGTPLTTTFVDYAMPSAAELPSYETHHTVTPTPLNPLGAKGIGESGTIGSTPAVHNAVVDALSHLGVRHLDMPCTPERVWRAVQESAGRQAVAAPTSNP